jgi:hypothetical protein
MFVHISVFHKIVVQYDQQKKRLLWKTESLKSLFYIYLFKEKNIHMNRTRSFLFLTFEMEVLLMVNGHIHFLIVKMNSGQNNIRTTFRMILC